MDDGPDNVGCELVNDAGQLVINVGNAHGIAGLGEDVCDSASGADRDVALVCEAASNDEDL